MTDAAPDPTDASAPQERRPARRSLRQRILLALGLVLLTAVIFYQPILAWVLETTAITIARQANIELSLQIRGNIFSELSIESVQGKAIGETPVRRLSIEKAHFHYSLPRMFRGGISELLTSYHLRNAAIEIDELPETASAAARQNTQRLTTLLRDILQQPALFSNRVELENVNIRVNLKDGLLSFDSIHILLDPVDPGFISIGRISIPHLPSWHQLSANASYNGRRLIIDKLELGGEMEITHAELIPAHITGGNHILQVEAGFFGGKINLDLRSQGTDVRLQLGVRDISLSHMSEYFQLEPAIHGSLESLDADLTGEAEDPSSWVGNLALEWSNAAIDQLRLDTLALQTTLEKGQLRLHDTRIVTGENELTLEAGQPLPDEFGELLDQGINLRYTLRSPHLNTWHPSLPDGNLDATGTVLISREQLALGAEAQVRDLSAPGFALRQASLKLDATAPFQGRTHETPWFFGLKLNARLDTSNASAPSGNLTLHGLTIDHAAAAVQIDERRLTLESLEIRREENHATASGTLQLPHSTELVKAWEELEFTTRLEIDAPRLAAFNAPGSPDALKGRLSARATVERKAGSTGGEAHLTASDLAWNAFTARSLELHLPLKDEQLTGATLLLDLNGTDKLEGRASLDLRPPYAYDAAVAGKLHDLSTFQELAGELIGGSLDLEWKGSGQWEGPEGQQHTGAGHLTLKDGLFRDVQGVQADLAGTYSPTRIDLSRLHLETPKGKIDAKAEWAEQRLRIPEIRLSLGEHGSASGHLALPLDLSSLSHLSEPARLLPADGALDGTLTVEQIDLARLFPDPPPPPADKRQRRSPKNGKDTAPPGPGLEGKIDAALSLSGTIASPGIALTVKGRNLHTRRADKLQPGTLEASLALQANTATLHGEVRIPTISPLRLEGSIPFDLHRVLREKRIDPATPLKASVLLPSSSAKVVNLFVPSLRYIEGTLSMDAKAEGTLGKPQLSGGLHFNLPAVRMNNPAVPGINRFRGDLLFSGNKLTLQRFGGDAAGGPFTLTGNVEFKDLKAPKLDLQLKSTGALLVRNDTLTVRTDTDLKLTGPLPTATVKGRVFLRKSRFYRDVEILPVALPGKPVAEPVQTDPEISITAPPIRDWTFNVAVRTKEPFLIRSNMARGAATVDLRLGGTGLAPTLDGVVRLENLVASLPFSKLEIEHGFIRFNPADSFNPSLDIHGSSRIRNSMVHAHIYGTASDPETVFTSEPPLPQEEIISLLATGATTQSLTENNEVMAGRATSLLLQDLYRKVVKKRPIDQRHTPGDNPLGDRFSLDVGTVDPRTGRQELGGRLQLNDEFELGAGMDIEGDVRVQLRYLLRFR